MFNSSTIKYFILQWNIFWIGNYNLFNILPENGLTFYINTTEINLN